MHTEHIRKDIRDFKAKNNLDFLAVMWTANTERFTDVSSIAYRTAIQGGGIQVGLHCVFSCVCFLCLVI